MTSTFRTALGRSLLAMVAIVIVLTSLGATRGATDTAATDGPIVLVSGRDDHGQQVADQLPLHDRPDGAAVDTIAADTLAEVRATSGTWLLVASLEGEPSEGWIDEFLVRGELHVVSPDTPACPVPTVEGALPASARVQVADVHHAGVGSDPIGVVTVADGIEHHVDRTRLRELPGPQGSGASCADVRDVPDGAHHH